MAFEHARVVEVRHEGRTVGALAPGVGVTEFQYDPAWLRTGIELAPFLMPIAGGSRIYAFRGLRPETFFTLPPTIADSLPDRFGNALIDAWMQRQGITSADVTPLDRLAYVDGRAMGALEYEPSNGPAAEPPTIIDLAALTVAAREAVAGRLEGDDARTTSALQTLLRVGTSAGGARPKAVLNLEDATGEFRAGVFPPHDGESAWLLKFDGATDDRTLAESRQYTRIEYAYALMAAAAGIEMMESRLLHEGGRAHFMTRRFDRPSPGARVHMTTLCGMRGLDNDLVGAHDYAQLFQTILELELGEAALVEAFRRMAFNVMAVNHDDHTKNHAFLMHGDGRWGLAPAYDLTYANLPGHPYLGRHCMGIDGEFDLVDRARMLRLADRFAIPYAKRELDRVRAAVDRWPEFAAVAEVPAEQVIEVAAAHATLGRGVAA
jgi:serine/threonine-protein kinase HipA